MCGDRAALPSILEALCATACSFFFTAAFWLLGINWLALSFTSRDEPNTALFTIRLAAFVVILIGIWDKNRTISKVK